MRASIAIVLGMMTLPLISQAERAQQITVPLSNPDQPGILIVHHYKGSINVVGYEGAAIVVKASLHYGSDATTPAVDLGAVEKDNHVVLSAGPRHRTIDLDILVPRRFSLQLTNDDSGTIRVEHISGQIEVSNLNGDIDLVDVAGSALLDTVDGDITAQFSSVTPGVPMAFTSLEGNIEVTFPADIKAFAKIRADHGPIVNDFAPTSEIETPSVTEAGRALWTYTDLNGGGPAVQLWSFCGRVHIRRAEKDQNTSAAVTIPRTRSFI